MSDKWLRDREELRSLAQVYARAADDRDVERLTALFHPDAEIVGSRGAQDLDGWLDVMRGPRTFPGSMHVLGDPLIEHDEDADDARLDTYAVVYQLGDTAKGQADMTLGIRYRDEAVRHEGRWVIRRRRADTLWMR